MPPLLHHDDAEVHAKLYTHKASGGSRSEDSVPRHGHETHTEFSYIRAGRRATLVLAQSLPLRGDR